ncbi:MAG: SURF1 family cytochrome oxidase biogenesis protein [Novosphingobium sp.]
MIKRTPIIPTVLVLIAVGVMVRLGFWQIDRMHQKADLLARYAAAEQLSADVTPNQFGGDRDAILYRHTAFACDHVTTRSAIAGLSDKGASGIAHTVQCLATAESAAVPITVTLGWSSSPAPPAWDGGQVSGLVAPMGKTGIRVVADPPLAGLQANGRPDPKDLPNNHWSYAIQWFLFAGTALVIYGLALRKRLAVPDPAG